MTPIPDKRLKAMVPVKLLEEINSRGTTVVVVTHNLEIVKAMNKRVITMKKGVVVEDSEGDYSDED